MDSFKVLESKVIYPHYHLPCGFMYFGEVKDVIEPCPVCPEESNKFKVFAGFGDKNE